MLSLAEIRPGHRVLAHDKPVEKLPRCPLHSSDFEFLPVKALANPLDAGNVEEKFPRSGLPPDRIDQQRH